MTKKERDGRVASWLVVGIAANTVGIGLMAAGVSLWIVGPLMLLGLGLLLRAVLLAVSPPEQDGASNG